MVSDAQGQKTRGHSKRPSQNNIDLDYLQRITEEPDINDTSFDKMNYLPGM